MLRLLLALVTATAAASSLKTADSANSKKLRANLMQESKIKNKATTTVTSLAELKLPAASHEELMDHIRAHPEWFVHMNIDDKHHITKMHPKGKVGGSAMSLLQLHIGMEIATKDKNGVVQQTQMHELQMSTLSDADKETVATIKSNVNVDTSASQGEDACPINSFVKTASMDEKDHSHVGVNPVCAHCAPKCEVCIGEGMDLCMKCAPMLGQEAFLVRLIEDPDICITKSKCKSAAGRKVNEKNFECEVDFKFTGTPISDDALFELAMEGEETADMDTLPIANGMLKASGKPEISPNEFKETLHEEHLEEQKAYKEGHIHGEYGTDAERKKHQEAEKKKKHPAAVTASLLEIKSKLKSGLEIAAEQTVGASPMNSVCDVYNKGWKNNQKVHEYVGKVIFGYSEGADAKLQDELDGAGNFGGMFMKASEAGEEHEKGFGKQIGMIVDEDMSADTGDSFWCQAMVVVEGLEAKIGDDSSLKSFLTLSAKIITVLEKSIGKNDLIKNLLGLIKDVFNWMENMRGQWEDRLQSLQSNPGYTQGVSKMCDFSNSFRTFLSKMQSMCHVNDLLNSNNCKSQSMFSVGASIASIAQHKVQAQQDEVEEAFEDLAGGSDATAANAADLMAPMASVFTDVVQTVNLAKMVHAQVAPFWDFLETDHHVKFGCVAIWLPTFSWWSPYFYKAGETCVIDFTANILGIFNAFASIISLVLSFLKFMFQPLIDAVQYQIQYMKDQALTALENKFNANFNLDNMLVLPNLINGFDSKVNHYVHQIKAALPMDAMLQGFDAAKNKLTHLTAQEESGCGGGGASKPSGESCDWGPGDGTGGQEVHVGSATSKEACIALVRAKRPTANGVTMQKSSGACFAEIGMKSQNRNAGQYDTCFLRSNPVTVNPNHCDWSTGDGTGGQEIHVGSSNSREACVALVKSKKPNANGVTMQKSNGACFAEIGMTGQNSNAGQYETCLL